MANIIISGASRGIGLELVKAHLTAGDHVHALARNPSSAGLAALTQDAGERLTIHAMDVADDASVARAAAAAGDAAIDILYNVAGIIGKEGPALEPGDWEGFDACIEIMLKGPLRVLRAFLPHLGEGSKVINFSSQLAASTWPYGGFYGYVAAKAGLNRLMRSAAIDLKDRGIVIGILHPGYVQTDMGGPEADISPAESAAGIMQLARGWTLERSGDFYKWNGEAHAW